MEQNNYKKILLLFLTLILISIIVIKPSFANYGVGVGTGKIEVDEILRPGLTYELPPITVFNTGEIPSNYFFSIEHGNEREGLQPEERWFSFQPKNFYLQPNEAQVVEVKLNLPIRNVKPGNYFAFVTAQPLQEVEQGEVSVGIAAASKLYFTIEPANMFQALFYKLLSSLSQYHPWSTIITAMLLLGLLLKLFNKKFKIRITKQK